MIAARLPYYAALLAAVALAGYALAVAGLSLCSPPPLHGDEWWTWRERFAEAAGLLVGGDEICFLPTTAGAAALRIGQATSAVLAILLFGALLWETLGIRLRRLLRGQRGGHAVLLGEAGEMEGFGRSLSGMPRAFVMRGRPDAIALARRLPTADVSILADRRGAARCIAEHRAERAALVAATSANDLANGEFAEAALARGGSAEVLVRLEQGPVRALKGDVLRRAAGRAGRSLVVVSLRLIQARQALALAMPGRFATDRASRVHMAICGAGPMVQEMAFLLARQGYGLESGTPLLSILRTGRSDFGPGALERLLGADAVDIQAITVDGEDATGIDRAFSAMALNADALAAIHCCEEEEGGAIALALRLERALVDLDLPVPPIVVHGAAGARRGDTGMIRVVDAPTLAEARTRARLMDVRAAAFHEAYIAGQRAARGAEFGTLPAERPWQDLSEQFREDNRASADHLDYKLASIGLAPTADDLQPAAIGPEEMERLAAMEHARWMARRGVSGWRYGPARDDRAMLHPDMKPYSELDQDAQRKDREQVATLVAQLAHGGERPVRLRRIAFVSAAGVDGAMQAVARAGARAGWRPLAVVHPETAEGVAIAEAALAAGLAIEALVTRAPEQCLGDDGLARRAATILRQAWRIVAIRDRDPHDVLNGADHVFIDGEGDVEQALLA